MSDPFVAAIFMFTGDFAPRGWAFCNGQVLSIAQNTALFSLLGTTYGGNGQTTFALPDLRGRVPIHPGSGYDLGQSGGSEAVTLTQTSMPAHIHSNGSVAAFAAAGTSTAPTGNVWAVSTAGDSQYSSAAPDTAMAPLSGVATGGSQPHSNMQPYTTINFIIALEGIYPSRS